MFPILLLLAAVYGWANRFAGGGFGWEKLAHDHGGPLRGHSTLWAGLGAVLVSTLIGVALLPHLTAPLGMLAFGWALCRAIDFPKDTATPDTLGEIALAFGRHALVAAVGQGVGILFHLPHLGLCLLAWAVAATGLAIFYGVKNHQAAKSGKPIDPQLNVFVEVGQGALLGVAIWVGLQPSIAAIFQ